MEDSQNAGQMKPHAAALALLGWYLIAPPRDKQLILFNQQSPLSLWVTVEEFETLKGCQAGKKSEMDNMEKERHTSPRAKLSQEDALDQSARSLRAIAMKCIASDDPRLAK